MPLPRRIEIGKVPNPEINPTLSVAEAAMFCGLSRSAGYVAVKNGELPTIQLGGKLRVPTAKLRLLLGLPVTS